MDPTGGEILGLGGIAFALGNFVKGLFSDARVSKAETKVRDIEAQRAETKTSRDQETQELKTEVAVLKAQYQEVTKRLAEGTAQFKDLDAKMDTTNKLLNQIVGALKNSGFKVD